MTEGSPKNNNDVYCTFKLYDPLFQSGLFLGKGKQHLLLKVLFELEDLDSGKNYTNATPATDSANPSATTYTRHISTQEERQQCLDHC